MMLLMGLKFTKSLGVITLILRIIEVREVIIRTASHAILIRHDLKKHVAITYSIYSTVISG